MPKATIFYAKSAFLLGIAACSVSGQESSPLFSSTPPPENIRPAQRAREHGIVDRPSLERRNFRYHLCKGDVLELNFPLTPEFNQTATVQPDGYITLRGLGDLLVEGKTTPEMREALRGAYAEILHDPVVTVDLKDFEKPYLIVGGEVGRPGKYELRGETTVTQAVAIAGGFRESAKHSQVLLFRRASDNWVEVRKLDLKKMLQARNLQEDLQVRPGDMVFVPKNALSKIAMFIPRSSLGFYLNPGEF